MPEFLQLTELQEKLNFVQDRAAKFASEGKNNKGEIDLKLVKVYGENMTNAAILEKFNEDTAEMNDLGEQIGVMIESQKAMNRLLEPTSTMIHPAPTDGSKASMVAPGVKPPFKTLGEQIVKSAEYQSYIGDDATASSAKFVFEDYGLAELKTLFETSAGWAPESIRSPGLVDAVTRPIQLIDIIPSGTIAQAAAKYMEETTRTHAADWTAEAGTYKESTFVLTERTDPVEKITDSIPVTDEQLEDVSFAQSYLDMRIRFGVRQRLDTDILNGTGSTPEITGILNKSGIQTQAKGADPTFDAFHKAMTKIRVTGRAQPSHHIVHPNDWQKIRLTRTADGIYILGNPAEVGVERMWGLPVVQVDSITENTGLVGSFTEAWIQLLERRGLLVEMGFVGDQFKQGKQTIRASMRVVMPIFRASAFCTVTGLPA